jgi:hypothetical protein
MLEDREVLGDRDRLEDREVLGDREVLEERETEALEVREVLELGEG